jgi:hypothetical protein
MAKKKSAPSEAVVTPQERVKRYLVQRFYTRFHMSLILMGAGFTAMISNWTLLHWGVTKMWVRYPIAMTLSYLAFLAGVWLWIQYVDFRRASNVSSGDEPEQNNLGRGRRARSKGDAGDLLDIPLNSGSSGGSSMEIPNIVRGGGGSFDGGGAGGAWGEGTPVQAFAGNSSPGVSSSGGGLKDAFSGFGDLGDLDGDAAILIVLALVLIGAILVVSGYIVWFAPDILSEAVFGATLAGSLAGTARRQDNEGWVMGVVKKTWWPFAIVFAAAMSFAIYAQIHYPAARTLGEALSTAIAG